MSNRISLLAALCGAILLIGVAPAWGASRPPRPGVYKLAVPSAGHAAVAAVEVRVVKHGRGRPPSRLSIALPKRFSMPSSVRFFYVRRRIAVTRFELLLLALNRATGGGAARAAKAPPVDAGRLTLLFPSRASSDHTCGNCGKKLPRKTRCPHCWFKQTVTGETQLVNADTADPADMASLLAALRGDWTNNGDTNSVFGNPSAGLRGDPTLDGGHLDNGHAFGWTKASLADPAPVLHTVVDDLLTSQPSKLIPDLELIGNADLNGNGKLDASTTPGGGTSA